MGPDMNLKEWGHPGQLLNSLQVRLRDLEVHLPTAECYDVIAFCNGRSSRAPALPCRCSRAPFHESTDQTSKVPLRLPMKGQHSARVENTPTHSIECFITNSHINQKGQCRVEREGGTLCREAPILPVYGLYPTVANMQGVFFPIRIK